MNLAAVLMARMDDLAAGKSGKLTVEIDLAELSEGERAVLREMLVFAVDGPSELILIREIGRIVMRALHPVEASGDD